MLLALVTGVGVLFAVGPESLFMLIFAVSIIAIFEINKYLTDHPDGSGIVIDKVAGLWLSLLIPYSTAASLSIPYAAELSILFGVASFLLFDHWKPSTIAWLRSSVKGGLGRVGSAVLSGIAGGFLAIVLLLGTEKIL
jgi:phosphatidylglycerophosphatase A